LSCMEDSDEIIRKHDALQFEVKLGYELNHDRRKDRYRVETYFFVPSNLDVNEATYSKNQFYRDLLVYIRFKTPDFTFDSLLDPTNIKSPLTKIHAALERDLPDGASLDYESKLLGCILKSLLRDRVNALARGLRGKGGDAWKKDAMEFLAEVRRAAAAFRAFKPRVKSPPVSPKHAATYLFTDEYISLLIEGAAHRFLRALNGRTDAPEGLRQAFVALVQSEVDYRRSMNYPSLVDEASDNEVFLFRLSVLKKFAASVLHLSVRVQEEGQGLKQFALAVAAGIAMLFAAAVAFYYQKTYGALSFSFFLALVISYMFKDRLKAFFQSYFEKALARRLFDLSTAVYEPFSNETIGLCRESVRFISEKTVDARVMLLRNRDHITEIENDWRSESVLLYTKEMTLFSQKLFARHARKTGLTDIARFTVRNFLLKMDEPKTDLYLLRDGHSQTITGTRVYHVNVVVKFIAEKKITYERIRLVLTRNGIKRIENVCSETVPA